MLIKLVLHVVVVNIISGYAPQTGCTRDEKDSLIEDMETVVRVLLPTEKIIIGADLNEHVGATTEDYESVLDGLKYNARNDEGSRLLEVVEGPH
jgi:hypothetical protein